MLSHQKTREGGKKKKKRKGERGEGGEGGGGGGGGGEGGGGGGGEKKNDKRLRRSFPTQRYFPSGAPSAAPPPSPSCFYSNFQPMISRCPHPRFLTSAPNQPHTATGDTDRARALGSHTIHHGPPEETPNASLFCPHRSSTWDSKSFFFSFLGGD